jgi:O-ureido-D-serine cyclo-ligase
MTTRSRIALVSARTARQVDEDLPALLEAFRAAGADASAADWDDDSVDWGSFDVALLRSPWDYSVRYAEFCAWAERAASSTDLRNSLPMVRWNTDKHYLLDLARAQVPVIPSHAVEPRESVAAALDRFLAANDQAEIVVKPTVGAGSRDVQRHDRTNRESMMAHAQRLLDAGRSILLQPYVVGVEERGETALIFFSGRFSHAIRKGPMLRRGEGASQSLFAEEEISSRVATPEELRVAEQALAAIPFEVPLYARVDLIRGAANNPLVLEVELTEPSLFFAYAPGAVKRYVDAILTAVQPSRL